ncbi:MAG: hypothetical protein EOO27_19975 [Comamonadaceae bacterium]|nr:MAG: hypothetical protein EOO27_19975 [Comamonadaceae bacterium]
MKAALFVTVAVVSYVQALAAPPAPDRATAASACYVIANPDARALCRAKALREPAHCDAIQKPDLRAQCRSEVLR